jgi:hypothetical protein
MTSFMSDSLSVLIRFKNAERVPAMTERRTDL